MVVPFDEELGVTSQSEGFTRYRAWDFEATEPGAVPAAPALPVLPVVFEPGRQAGRPRVRALRVRRSFTLEQKRRDFAYYEADHGAGLVLVGLASRRSSPPRSAMLDLAYEYFRETALVDLRDLAGNTGHGVHLASLAGAWLVAVAGFGGLRDYGDVLSFAPTLPAGIRRLRSGCCIGSVDSRVEVLPGRREVHAARRRAAEPASQRSIGRARGRCSDDTCLGHRPAGTGVHPASEVPGAITTGRRRRGVGTAIFRLSHGRCLVAAGSRPTGSSSPHTPR